MCHGTAGVNRPEGWLLVAARHVETAFRCTASPAPLLLADRHTKSHHGGSVKTRNGLTALVRGERLCETRRWRQARWRGNRM